MNPEIRRFPSSFFYNDILKDSNIVKENEKHVIHTHHLFKPYVVFDVGDSYHSRNRYGSLRNSLEAHFCVHLFKELRDFLIRKMEQARKSQGFVEQPPRVKVIYILKLKYLL